MTTTPHTRHASLGNSSRQALTTSLGSPLRWFAAVTLVVAGAVHIPVTPEHLSEAPYIGVLFIALTVACFGLALAMAARDTVGVWATAGVVTLLAFAAYVVSRSAGLPQIGDDIGNWAEPLGMVAIVAEAITFLAAAGVLAHRSHVLRSRPPGTGSSVIEEAP